MTYEKLLEQIEGTQEWDVLNHLLKHDGLTRFEGMEKYYIANVPEAVRKLREKGVNIKTDMVVKKGRRGSTVQYAVYKLNDGQEENQI